MLNAFATGFASSPPIRRVGFAGKFHRRMNKCGRLKNGSREPRLKCRQIG
jgi:hypothetical protein